MAVRLKDFSGWNVYSGSAEGSGRSEKVWLISPEHQAGLFKFPKLDPATGHETSEHISEHLACRLGQLLDVKTAKVDIGTYHGRIGSMSYQVNQSNQELREGIYFISSCYQHYDAEKMIDTQTGQRYCLEMIFKSIEARGYVKTRASLVEMMMFDFLIGNADRHQSNWAGLYTYYPETNKKGVRRCPLYDNGSSLCCYVNDGQIEKMFGRDPGPFRALADSKSRSIIRIDGYAKALPTHKDVARYLLEHEPKARETGKRFLDRLNESEIDKLLDVYPETLLSPGKNQLIRRFLRRKMEILDDLMKGY